MMFGSFTTRRCSRHFSGDFESPQKSRSSCNKPLFLAYRQKPITLPISRGTARPGQEFVPLGPRFFLKSKVSGPNGIQLSHTLLFCDDLQLEREAKLDCAYDFKTPRLHKTIYSLYYTLICPSLTLPARKVQKVPILFSRFTDEFCVFLFVTRRRGN